MEKLKNKKIIIICCSVVLVCLAGILFYSHYKNVQEQKEIDSHISLLKDKANKSIDSFNKKETREEKLNILKEFIKDADKYNSDKSKFGGNQSLKVVYTDNIKEMKDWFIKDYDNRIKQNTINDDKLNNEFNKDVINNAKNNLQTVVNNINSEKETLKLSEIESFVKTINDLNQKYNSRLKFIQEEEQRKAEEQRKLEEQKKAEQSKNNSFSNNRNSQSNNKQSSNRNNNTSKKPSGSSNKKHSGGRYVVKTETHVSNGVVSHVYFYSDGTIIFVDADGTTIDITNNGDIFG